MLANENVARARTPRTLTNEPEESDLVMLCLSAKALPPFQDGQIIPRRAEKA
jgi:hypothetical protein